jgi:hypothetical protein
MRDILRDSNLSTFSWSLDFDGHWLVCTELRILIVHGTASEYMTDNRAIVSCMTRVTRANTH